MNSAPTSGQVIRLMTLMTHYRQDLNFTTKRMAEAHKILTRWLTVATPCTDQPPLEVLTAITTDLNTPLVIAKLHEYRNQKQGNKLYAALNFLGFFDEVCLPDEIKTIPQDQLGDAQPGPAIVKSFRL
jgi:cysteinyl-tRNA synthetase